MTMLQHFKMKTFSKDFPLIHQIAFHDATHVYSPNKNIKQLFNYFGGTNYKIWFLEETRSFLQREYSANVLKAFDKITPFAYKADLARYCIVNHFGGTYLDLSMNSIKTPQLGEEDMLIFRDLNSNRTSWKVSNGIFYSRPNQRILLEAITQCVDNILSDYYGLDPHFPTGPGVFGRAVAKYGPESNIIIGQCFWFKYRRNKYVVNNDFVVARGKIGGKYLGGKSELSGGNNYNTLWKSQGIYGENQ